MKKPTETLKGVMSDIKDTIEGLEEVVERYKDEECGVDKYSGHYGQTSGYIAKIEFETQLNTLKDVYEMLKNVKRVK